MATSPNIPNVDAVFGYPALGLLGEVAGGAQFSIGGVVNSPFQCVGATWLDAEALAGSLQRRGLKGLKFSPRTVLQGGKAYRCVDIDVTEPVGAPLVALNFHVLEAVRQVSGRDLLREAEKAGRGLSLFDKAAGSDEVRSQWRQGWSANRLVQSWRDGEESFRKARWRYLIYRDAVARQVPGREVVVAKGDTVYGIALKHGLTVSALLQANPGVRVDRLQIGSRLRLPAP